MVSSESEGVLSAQDSICLMLNFATLCTSCIPVPPITLHVCMCKGRRVLHVHVASMKLDNKSSSYDVHVEPLTTCSLHGNN